MSIPIYTREQFLEAFLRSLPRGRAWPKDRDSNLTRTINALMPTVELNSARAGNLINDTFPARTQELLPEWEASVGLPDPCQGEAPTVEARRNQVVARFANTGGQSITHLKEFAKNLGYDISITEYVETRVGTFRAGDALIGDGVQFQLKVFAPAYNVRRFIAGAGAAGDPLSSFGNAVLECELNHIKPAHSKIVFAYDVPPQITRTGSLAATLPLPTLAAVGALGNTVTLSLTSQPTTYRVYQRTSKTGAAFSKGSGAVSFGLTLSGATSTLQYRLRDYDVPGTTLVDWVTLPAASSGAQTISVSAMPATAKWYIVDFRTGSDNSTMVSTTNRFGVGDIWLHGGQSQQVDNIMGLGQNQGTNASTLGLATEPYASTYVYANNGTVVSNAWRPLNVSGGELTPSSPYLSEFCRQMVAQSGVVTAVAGCAVGATTMSNWDATNDSNMMTALSVYSGMGGGAAGYNILIGGTDAVNGTTKASFKASLAAHWNLIKSNVEFPLGAGIHVVPMGARQGTDAAVGSDANIQAIRDAQLEFVRDTPDASIAYTWPDVSVIASDGIHQNAAGARLMGARYALTAQRHLGLRTTDARGPQITSATRAPGSGDIILTVALTGATVLAALSANPVDGFVVYTSGTTSSPLTINSVTVGTPSNGSVPVTITLATAPSNDVALDIYNPRGKDTGDTNRDNLLYSNMLVPGSSVGLPLADSSLMYTVSAPVATSSAFPALGNKVVFRFSALDAANSLNLTTTTVDAIKDVSGGGYVLASSGPRKAAYSLNGGLNNKPYIDFGNNMTSYCDYSVVSTTLANKLNGAAQPMHIIALVSSKVATDQGSVFSVEDPMVANGFTSHAFMYLNNVSGSTPANDVYMLRGDSTATSTSYQVGSAANSLPASTWSVVEGSYDGANITARVGASSTSANTPSDGAFTAATTIRIGNRATSSGKARQLAANVSEIIVCNAVLTTAERADLIAWINAQYGGTFS